MYFIVIDHIFKAHIYLYVYISQPLFSIVYLSYHLSTMSYFYYRRSKCNVTQRHDTEKCMPMKNAKSS